MSTATPQRSNEFPNQSSSSSMGDSDVLRIVGWIMIVLGLIFGVVLLVRFSQPVMLTEGKLTLAEIGIAIVVTFYHFVIGLLCLSQAVIVSSVVRRPSSEAGRANLMPDKTSDVELAPTVPLDNTLTEHEDGTLSIRGQTYKDRASFLQQMKPTARGVVRDVPSINVSTCDICQKQVLKRQLDKHIDEHLGMS